MINNYNENMSHVEFEEDNNLQYINTVSKKSRLVKYVMDITGIEDTKKVNYIIITIITIIIVISLFLFLGGNKYEEISPSSPNYVPAEI